MIIKRRYKTVNWECVYPSMLEKLASALESNYHSHKSSYIEIYLSVVAAFSRQSFTAGGIKIELIKIKCTTV